MYQSTSQRQLPTAVRPCLFDDEDDCDNGSKATIDADSSDFIHEVYLCMVWHGGFLGLAYYDLGSLQIHFMLDIQENDKFATVRQVVHQIHPSVITLNTIQDSRLLSFLRSIVSEIRVSQSASSNEICRLEFLPNVDFNYQVCKRRILALDLPSVPQHLSQDERFLYFSSLLPFGTSNMILSVGGLLKYLEKSRVGIELEADIAHVPVLGFKSFIPEHHIQMDGLTYCALKIFETEVHPSTHKAGHKSGGGREGLSLYGILNRCKSRIGSRLLREWFLRPLKNAAPIRQRHEAVAFFMSAHNMEVVKCLSGCLKHIKYIPKILLRMSKAQAAVGDWNALYKTLYHAVYIGDIAKAQPNNIDIFRKIANAFTEDLHRCVNLICKTIDFLESKNSKRFVVLPHVDKDLDEKKRTFNGLPSLMNEVARQEIESLSSDIQECTVSYLPEIGYLLMIDLPEGKTPEDDHTIEGMNFMFHSNNQLYYKSAKTIELDELLGDTQRDIMDIELNIMHRLQATILECTSVMLTIMELTAELDCLMALALCANEFDYVQPSLVQENVIHIKASRHPLQELCCNTFVPNDVRLGGDSSKMKLITGPNACGKSVYLKQVAVTVFMAHIGSFVPAEEARIGPCDAIFSRLKSVESTAVHMSTFMQDLSQVSQALRSASSKSLVVVDEFGKGTEATDGLALLTAVIKYWLAKEMECPFTLIATHFHSIIQQRLLPRTNFIEYLTFETLANDEELVFLYQVVPGHTSSSYACKCAAQVGIPSDVIKRAKQVSDLLCQAKAVPLEDSSESLARKQMHERIVDNFLDLNLNKDDVNKFLKEFVLKECEAAAQAGKDSRPVIEDGKGKKESHPLKRCTKNLFNPLMTRTEESMELGFNESDQIKSGLNRHKVLDTRAALLGNGDKAETGRKETQKLIGNYPETISREKYSLTFETPTFPVASNSVYDDAKKQFQPSHNQTDATETASSGEVKDKHGVKGKMQQGINYAVAESNFPQTSQSKLMQKRWNQKLPLFATPSSPKLSLNEDYRQPQSFNSTFVAGVKRKMGNVGPSITQIKHEKLFNPPTPCFSFVDRSVAHSSKTTSSASARGDSPTTDDLRTRGRDREISTPSSHYLVGNLDIGQSSSKTASSASMGHGSPTSDDLGTRDKGKVILTPRSSYLGENLRLAQPSKTMSSASAKDYSSSTSDDTGPRGRGISTPRLSFLGGDLGLAQSSKTMSSASTRGNTPNAVEYGTRDKGNGLITPRSNFLSASLAQSSKSKVTSSASASAKDDSPTTDDFGARGIGRGISRYLLGARLAQSPKTTSSSVSAEDCKTGTNNRGRGISTVSSYPGKSSDVSSGPLTKASPVGLRQGITFAQKQEITSSDMDEHRSKNKFDFKSLFQTNRVIESPGFFSHSSPATTTDNWRQKKATTTNTDELENGSVLRQIATPKKHLFNGKPQIPESFDLKCKSPLPTAYHKGMDKAGNEMHSKPNTVTVTSSLFSGCQYDNDPEASISIRGNLNLKEESTTDSTPLTTKTETETSIQSIHQFTNRLSSSDDKPST